MNLEIKITFILKYFSFSQSSKASSQKPRQICFPSCSHLTFVKGGATCWSVNMTSAPGLINISFVWCPWVPRPHSSSHSVFSHCTPSCTTCVPLVLRQRPVQKYSISSPRLWQPKLLFLHCHIYHNGFKKGYQQTAYNYFGISFMKHNSVNGNRLGIRNKAN